ncbi:MAG: class I SAM-dependent methyltransferase [Hyphomicrobium sp.]
MSGFSAEWLALREGADARARNPGVADAVAARFQLRDRVSIIDLGCGAGANLRATSALLPQRQSWTLVDVDADLLDRAKSVLSSWADDATASEDGLALIKGSAEIAVRFRQADLSHVHDSLIADGADLVTASALFDLASADVMRKLARAAADVRASFYAVLTYNGVQRWSPHRPADNQIASAFNHHQMRDKGLGPALGPTAPGFLADQFRLNGYTVLEGESAWRLGRGDRMLIDEMVRGYAMAAAETGLVDSKTIEGWIKVTRAAAEIGHIDIFAAPV